MKRRVVLLLGMIIGFGSIPACSTLGFIPEKAENSSDDSVKRTVLSTAQSLPDLVADISSHRVIYIGETHDRYDHHLNQLAVIEELHDRGVSFAVGVEFFQRPFQHYLDQYVAGEIDEKVLLKLTAYYKNWGYDFRLYRPILEYARERGVALVALNAPSELVSRVSSKGLEGLGGEWKRMLPEIQIPADASYSRRLERVFAMHPDADRQFDRFLQVQLLWDEYMAASAAAYLQENPDHKLVVLAGSGHVAGGSGIPERVHSRVPDAYTVLISADPGSEVPDDPGHVIPAGGEKLPAAGKLGLNINEGKGGVTVQRRARGRTTGNSEVRPGDLIHYIAGERIRSMEDVRLAMLDRLPGEQVWVELERGRESGKPVRLATMIELI